MATQAEVAEQLGISDRWLRELIGQGIISKAPVGKMDLGAVAREYIAHLQTETQRLNAEVASVRAAALRADGSGKSVEDERRAKAQADIAEMKAAQMRSELVPSEQVSSALGQMIVSTRTRLLAIATKVAQRVGAKNPAVAEAVIREEIIEALSGLSKIKVNGEAGRVKDDDDGSTDDA